MDRKGGNNREEGPRSPETRHFRRKTAGDRAASPGLFIEGRSGTHKGNDGHTAGLPPYRGTVATLTDVVVVSASSQLSNRVERDAVVLREAATFVHFSSDRKYTVPQTRLRLGCLASPPTHQEWFQCAATNDDTEECCPMSRSWRLVLEVPAKKVYERTRVSLAIEASAKCQAEGVTCGGTGVRHIDHRCRRRSLPKARRKLDSSR